MEFNDLRALEAVLKTLEPLTEDERVRVLKWCVEKLGIETIGIALSSALRKDVRRIHPVEAAFAKHSSGFQTIGQFVSAANPRTDVDRVLCAALFLQDLGEEPGRALSGKEINDELKHLGHGVKNITDCINTLKSRKPQHMIQIKKNGKSRQAWKEYSVTEAGGEYVFKLINNGSGDEEA